MKKAIAAVVVLALLFAGGFYAGTHHTEKNISTDEKTISATLEKCSDLASARYDYTGLIKYEDGKYTFLTKTGFSMVYDSYVKAGIDLGDADVSVSGGEISVVLPEAKVTDVVIDESSLEFYDKKFALLNRRDETDTKEALKIAKKDAEDKATEAGIIEMAEKNAADLVEGILEPAAGGRYTVNITVKGK